MIEYLKKTWYFFVFRFLLMILDFLVMILLSSGIQVAIWKLLNVGILGMIIGGLIGLIISYLLISYVDSLLLFTLKLWNISVIVNMDGNVTNDRRLSKFFPEIGAVVLANSLLRKAGNNVFTAITEELKDDRIFNFFSRCSKNFFVKNLLKNMVDFIDECTIFYVLKKGDVEENTMVNLGRGVLFYVKAFPKMLIGSLKAFIFTDILFFVIFMIPAIVPIMSSNSIPRAIYMSVIAIIWAKIAHKMLAELIKMSFMLNGFNKCIVNTDEADTHIVDNNNDNSNNNDNNNNDDNIVVCNQERSPMDHFSSLIQQYRGQETDNIFSLDSVMEQQSTAMDNSNSNTHTTENISDRLEDICRMPEEAVYSELQNLGVTIFNKYFRR